MQSSTGRTSISSRRDKMDFSNYQRTWERIDKGLDGIEEKSYFYFVHSYYVNPFEKETIVAETSYGISFLAVLAQENIYGTQFHPEKSGVLGEQILLNFAQIVKR